MDYLKLVFIVPLLAVNLVILLPERIESFIPEREIVFLAEVEAKTIIEEVKISSSTIKEFIISKAIENGISTTTALWIVRKESNFETDRIGDGGKICKRNGKPLKSVGLWQIEINCYNEEVSEEFAKDISSSTEWAMKQIKRGNYKIWSVWKNCQKWFPKECPL